MQANPNYHLVNEDCTVDIVVLLVHLHYFNPQYFKYPEKSMNEREDTFDHYERKKRSSSKSTVLM